MKEFEVRELTGEDEEALARIVASTPTQEVGAWLRYRRAVVERGLVRIGSHQSNQEMIKSLHIGDLDAVLLAIRIATWGPDYEADIHCSQCQEQVPVIFELDKDIRYKTWDDFSFVKVTLRDGRAAHIRHVLLDDQDYAFADPKATMAEVNTRVLSRVLVDVEGVNLISFHGGSLEYARKLGIKDREILGKALSDLRFGPDLEEVVVACPECQQDWKGSLSMPALFR